MKALKLVAVLLAVLIVSLPVAFATETSLVYDRNGNLQFDGEHYRVYNDFNQLVEIRNGSNASAPLLESYRHHPVEERIAVKYVYNSSGEIAQRVLYHDKNFVTVINASGTFNFTYVYHEGVLIAQNTPSGKEFIHPDHKGSVNFVTNDAGTPIENTTFDGFGNIIAGGESTRFDYEGKEFSSVVGDYDFHFRKYSPSLGIFTQPDTLISNVYDPQLLNRYSFERNNPYKYFDPDGHIYFLIKYLERVSQTLDYYKQNIANSFKQIPYSEYAKNAYEATTIADAYDILEWGIYELLYQDSKKSDLKMFPDEIKKKREDAFSAILGISSSFAFGKILGGFSEDFASFFDYSNFFYSVSTGNDFLQDTYDEINENIKKAISNLELENGEGETQVKNKDGSSSNFGFSNRGKPYEIICQKKGSCVLRLYEEA